ncbi:MAG TPA: PEP-CTERM sorting domain-containing protein [Verrucomicrobiae bacterium]|nr:PEP-CTERM sorting domain-containing protein [Verrucomicrobiae bacterium]
MNSRTLNRTLKIASFAAALLALAPWQPGRADTIALDFTGGGGLFPVSPQTVGWAFTLNTSVTVTNLGLYDTPNDPTVPATNPPGDGLLESHPVTIWTSAGVQVAQATVDNSGTLVDGFRYVSIAPTMLAAGNYVIGGFYMGVPPTFPNTTDRFIANAIITTAPEVTYTESRSFSGGSGPTFPSGNVFAFPNGYFGPNFQFTTPTNGNGVPEGGSGILLLAVGVGAVVAVRKQRAASSEVEIIGWRA